MKLDIESIKEIINGMAKDGLKLTEVPAEGTRERRVFNNWVMNNLDYIFEILLGQNLVSEEMHGDFITSANVYYFRSLEV